MICTFPTTKNKPILFRCIRSKLDKATRRHTVGCKRKLLPMPAQCSDLFSPTSTVESTSVAMTGLARPAMLCHTAVPLTKHRACQHHLALLRHPSVLRMTPAQHQLQKLQLVQLAKVGWMAFKFRRPPNFFTAAGLRSRHCLKYTEVPRL